MQLDVSMEVGGGDSVRPEHPRIMLQGGLLALSEVPLQLKIIGPPGVDSRTRRPGRSECLGLDTGFICYRSWLRNARDPKPLGLND